MYQIDIELFFAIIVFIVMVAFAILVVCINGGKAFCGIADALLPFFVASNVAKSTRANTNANTRFARIVALKIHD